MVVHAIILVGTMEVMQHDANTEEPGQHRTREVGQPIATGDGVLPDAWLRRVASMFPFRDVVEKALKNARNTLVHGFVLSIR